MKRNLFILLICGLPFTGVYGQAIPENDSRLIDEFISSKITIEKKLIESDSLKKVFRGAFYFVTPVYIHKGGSASSGDFMFAILDGKVLELDETSESRSLDILFSLLQKGFTIKNENEAKVFEAALDKLYPLSWSDKPEFKKRIKAEGKWLFIRGEFFDALRGFVVTLDQNSVITKIEYNLEAIKKEE